MVIQLVAIYYMYSNWDKISLFFANINGIVSNLSSLVNDVGARLEVVDDLVPKLDETLVLLRDIQSKLDAQTQQPQN